MTLRSRLVAALVGLVALGLIIFGVTTYGLYSKSQYERLDDQVTNSLPLVSRQLTDDNPKRSPSRKVIRGVPALRPSSCRSAPTER